MKFAKELDREAVPEWRPKYLDYNLGKKKIKAISRALRDFGRTPTTPAFQPPVYDGPSDARAAGLFGGHRTQTENDDAAEVALDATPEPARRWTARKTPPITIKQEEQPLVGGGSGRAVAPMKRYGSIIGSPPREASTPSAARPPSLKLPDPALNTAPDQTSRRHFSAVPEEDGDNNDGATAYEAGKTNHPAGSTKYRSRSLFVPRLGGLDRAHLHRLWSLGLGAGSPGPAVDYPLDSYRQVENAQKDFFGFLDDELEKIELFYKEKEDEATNRLAEIRAQLHVLRDRRLQDIMRTRESERPRSPRGSECDSEPAHPKKSLLSPISDAWNVVRNGKVGAKSLAMEGAATPVLREDRRDYVRRRAEEAGAVSYRSAKRKLKMALLEYYRGLELLKAYAMLNRKAFRKINKKFDKQFDARQPGMYVAEKVNKAWFVNSDVVDQHILAVEDMYARYFEAGNHKVAVNKLRKAVAVREYHGGAMFRNGLSLAAGLVFGIEGLVAAARLLLHGSAEESLKTSYLLQIYGGYFLILLLMLYFCLACRFWTVSKVSYVFIFELDPRDHLNWRQLCELPCLFTFLLGIFLWLNFSAQGSSDMFLYYPILLIGFTAMFLFCPLPIFYWRARTWFLNACWRLLWSGLYPVEFRDFFLGDMFCSISYSMGNIELFFCLYDRHWYDPQMCNSSHSRLLGFFSTLPGIWRALQCIRRYADTKNVFPHLVNCGKYTCTILFYVSLSLYRISKTNELWALFIVFGSLNSIYCSVWDLVMDWSLLDPTAKFPLLRGTLAYKQTWLYYVAIIIDPILRFNWVFYAIFAKDIQHSAFLSFAISLSEICRRGLWILLRVENEHCSNMTRFRASRDVPLPFALRDTYTPATLEAGEQPPLAESEPAQSPQSVADDQLASKAKHGTPSTPRTPRATLRSEQSRRSARSERSLASGAEPAPSSHSLRLRASESPVVRGLSVVGAIMHQAHTQDFERRKIDTSPELEADSTDEEGEADVEEPIEPEPDFGVGEAARSGTVRRRKVSFGREDMG